MKKRNFLKGILVLPLILTPINSISYFFKKNLDHIRKVKKNNSIWILSEND